MNTPTQELEDVIMADVADLELLAKALGPWRYSHSCGTFNIEGDPVAAPIHGDYGHGAATLSHIIKSICRDREITVLRAIDIGCLEGHYSDILCAAGFREVVSIDLSEMQVKRAAFLLQEVRGYSNSKTLQGNIEDPEFLSRLGKFDVILFHGILYHLKDPVSAFKSLDVIASDDAVILLSTQFKFPFAEVVSPHPVANVKFRTRANISSDKVVYPGTQSTYDSVAVRLNPAAIYRILNAHGFTQKIAYNTVLGAEYGFQLHLVLTKSDSLNLLPNLSAEVSVPGLEFYAWRGDKLDGFDIGSKWYSRLTRFALRIAYSLGERLGKSNARQLRREHIRHV